VLLEVRGQLDDAGREARDLRLGGSDVGRGADDEGDLGEVGADATVAGAVLELIGGKTRKRSRFVFGGEFF